MLNSNVMFIDPNWFKQTFECICCILYYIYQSRINLHILTRCSKKNLWKLILNIRISESNQFDHSNLRNFRFSNFFLNLQAFFNFLILILLFRNEINESSNFQSSNFFKLFSIEFHHPQNMERNKNLWMKRQGWRIQKWIQISRYHWV